jgi:hypothetical protein
MASLVKSAPSYNPDPAATKHPLSQRQDIHQAWFIQLMELMAAA